MTKHFDLSPETSAALKARAVAERRPVGDVADELLSERLGRAPQPWPGFIRESPVRAAEMRSQLERDLGDGINLSGPVATEAELVASAQAHVKDVERAAAAASARADELERQARAAVPLATRLSDAPALANVLGVTAPTATESARALGKLSPTDYGMRALIGEAS